MAMRLRPTSRHHEALYQDLVKLIDKYAGQMGKEAVLAVAANLVGKLVALQDQRTMTVAEAMALVALNIEEGNQQALETLRKTPGGRA